MKLFGKAKQAPPAKDALKMLEEQKEVLEKRIAFLNKKMEDETENARRLAKQGNKNSALKCLKRKQMYEKQRAAMEGAYDSIEQQVMALQSAALNKQTLDVMQKGAKAQREAQGKMKVEQVDDIMLDIQEAAAETNAIGEALAQGIGGEMYDEGELMGELEMLLAEDVDAQLLGLGAETVPAKMPDVPQTLPKAKAKVMDDEEAELAALQAAMM